MKVLWFDCDTRVWRVIWLRCEIACRGEGFFSDKREKSESHDEGISLGLNEGY